MQALGIQQPLPPVRLVEFRFVPLETLDRVDLIASVDFSGTGFNYSLVAVWQSANGYGSARLNSFTQGGLARDVLDMDGTGIYSVVTDHVPGGYQGISTLPIPWYTIYALRGGKWTDVSDRYPDFFSGGRDVRIASAMADACDAGNKGLIEAYRDNAQFVQIHYLRAVSHIKNAGLETALGWADSPKFRIQELAIETLCDIPDPRVRPRRCGN